MEKPSREWLLTWTPFNLSVFPVDGDFSFDPSFHVFGPDFTKNRPAGPLFTTVDHFSSHGPLFQAYLKVGLLGRA